MTFKNYKINILKDSRSKNLNFKPDNRVHYVYRVSHLVEKQHYYGSKTEDIGYTIGTKYFTSSNYLKDDFKKNINNYKIKIVKRFNNSGDKILFESYLHDYFDVKSQDIFINRVNQTPWGFDRTGYVVPKEDIYKYSGANHSQATPIYQIDMITQKIIKEWAYVKEAANLLNISASGISHCLVGLNSSSAGFFWERSTKNNKYLKWKSSRKPESYKGMNNSRARSIYQVDVKTKEIIHIWEYIKLAAETLGLRSSGIVNCAKGNQNHCGHFLWVYPENYES